MKTISKKQLRNITVLVRYSIKNTGTVVLYIENDKGVRYYVRLQENGVNTCNCKAKQGTCYHIKSAINSEQARPFAAKRLPSWFVELVAKGVLVAPVKVMPTQKDVSPKEKIYTLNGAQQSAGLLSILPSRKKSA